MRKRAGKNKCTQRGGASKNDLPLAAVHDLTPRGHEIRHIERGAFAATDALKVMTFGGSRRDVMGDSCFLEPELPYAVIPFSFKAKAGSCVVRIYSSEPLRARLVDTAPDHATSLWASLHRFALSSVDVEATRSHTGVLEYGDIPDISNVSHSS